MKILIANDTYHPHVNGCSYFAQRLAHYLKKRGHDILVIVPSKNINSEFIEHNGIRVFGISSYPIPGIKDFRFSLPILQRNKIKKVIKDFNPDVIHLQGHFFIGKEVFNIARKMGYAIVGTNHFMPENLVHYLHLPAAVEKQIKNLAWKQFKAVFENLIFVTAPTKTAADLTKKSGISKEIMPISNGIDLTEFSPNPKIDKESLRKKYNLPKKLSLVSVGRLDREKNVDFVLKVLPEVLSKIDIHFIIAGKGNAKESLEKLVKKLKIEKNVSFLGFVPNEDLNSLFCSADCFVNACEAELQCLAAMEAMASGLPVVGVNALALPELIHHGENGYLFESGDKKALTEQLIKIFTDDELRKKMAQESLNIIAKHDIEETIQRFEDIYIAAIDMKKK